MATQTLTTSEQKKLAVLMRMALTYADARLGRAGRGKACGTCSSLHDLRVAIFCSHRRSLPALF